jgi:putative oxidoreductase
VVTGFCLLTGSVSAVVVWLLEVSGCWKSSRPCRISAKDGNNGRGGSEIRFRTGCCARDRLQAATLQQLAIFWEGIMKNIVNLLILLPAQIASFFPWAGPLVMRLVVGYVFMLTGWAKLNNLPQMIQNFTEWGIPFPTILTPFASGVECFGGALLILGLFTRIPAGMLVVVMIVAIKVAKWSDVDSLETFLGFEEVTYLAAFLWLAIVGPGAVSLDRLLLNATGNAGKTP